MIKLLLRDVGDGLNLFIKNSAFYDLAVDFGGNKNLDCYYCFDDSFLLTHFHCDHYNGILNCDIHHCCWHLDKFYHPVMPVFTDSKIFFMSLLAMNIRISRNHPIQSTILSLVSKLNKKPLQFISVAKGDIIICGKRKYEVLWPPKELKERSTLKVIKTAMKDFEKAKENDNLLKEIYNRINGHYLEIDINSFDENHFDDNFFENYNSTEVSEVIKNANNSLRNAANRLSVAFRQDDNLLFLGDLEKGEIRSVVRELIIEHKIAYDILISPHHGTHWDNILNKISADMCLASVGQILNRYLRYDYKNICNKFIGTHDWGDIRVSNKIRIK